MGRSRSPSLVALLGCLLLLGAPPPSQAATNSAYGGVRGLDNGTLLGGDGTGTAQFTIEPHRLSLVKQARDLTGRVLPDGADVDSGSEIYFVLLVDNPTAAPAVDIRLDDPVDLEQFQYLAGSLERTVVPTGQDPWAGSWVSLTDGLGSEGPDDTGSVLPTETVARVSFGAQAGQPNLPYALESRSTLALRFRVRVE